MNFTFTSQIQSSVVIISLSGKILSKENSTNLTKVIEDYITDNNQNFILDLKEVSYINSNGLSLLLKIFTHIRNKNGHLIIVHPNKTITNLFKISKLDTVFNISAEQQSAIKELNKIKK